MPLSQELLSAWQCPPAIYRGMTFWSWNEELHPDRLRRQIRSMHQAGMGGFFMHSRYGLKTEYLSEQWFHCIEACIDEARKLGMKACLYDEDRWPSGAAGGLVTGPHPEFRAHHLEAAPPEFADEASDRLAVLAVTLDAHGRLQAWRHVGSINAPTGEGQTMLVFQVRTAPPSPRFNDAAPLDVLNADAVAEFIRITHDAYVRRFGEDFGVVVPAIFTDEPNIGGCRLVPPRRSRRIPWTGRLAEEFQNRRGYDLLQHLPELFFQRPGEEFSVVRHDYFRTITELFVENFSAQVGRWCRRHGLAFTGHYLTEETLNSQANQAGATMPHYEQQDWPGIDILGDQAEELSAAKQCSSVADQLGKGRVLSELYGVTGWDWPLEGHKFIGDWQYAAGVNFRCHHLTWYSAAGGGKRDYPASIFEHSPWWKYYRPVEDYFGRLSAMLTQGRPVRDVLVIHPIESAWGAFRASSEAFKTEPSPLQAPLDRIMYTLSGQHYDWDFGDESLLARHAQATSQGFRVKRMTYRLVVVPPCYTLRSTTVTLLRDHVAAGGKLLFIGRRPTRIDCKEDAALDEVVASAASSSDGEEQFLPAIEALLQRRVSISEGGREQSCIWYMLRSVEDGQVLFLQSHDRKADHRVRVTVRGRGPVVLWDALTGQLTLIPAEVGQDDVEFDVDLPPTGSALLSLGLDVPQAAEPSMPPEVVESRSIAGPFEYRLVEPNTLPLDFCRWRIGDTAYSGPVPTLQADAEIRKAFGLPVRSSSGAQPWYLKVSGQADSRPRGRCQLAYAFHVTDLPAPCKLALERPGDYVVTVNGRPVGAPDGWWVDEDIQALDISGLLQTGPNEVLLTFEFRGDMELEDLYLVGDFGVGPLAAGAMAPGNVTIVRLPQRLQLGSWVGQGLDFYGGAVQYRLAARWPEEGKGLRVRLPDIECTAAAVHVGGRTFVLPWAPFEADVTESLREGENDILVEVIGGRKNILGPLHVPWERWTGPPQFSVHHKLWREEYVLQDHGLTAPVVLETIRL